jgi:hypothetical protein
MELWRLLLVDAFMDGRMDAEAFFSILDQIRGV